MTGRLPCVAVLACLLGIAGCNYPGRAEKLAELDRKIWERNQELKEFKVAETVTNQRERKKAALEKEIEALKQDIARLEKAKKSK